MSSEKSAGVTWGVRLFAVTTLVFVGLAVTKAPEVALGGLIALAAWGQYERGDGDRVGWPLAVLVVNMLAGMGIGVYMSRHHEIELYGGADMQGSELIGCSATPGVDCGLVNTSAWSEVFGIPTFTWAVPTYAFIAVLAVLAMSGNHRGKPLVVVAGVGSILFSAFLYYISVVELGSVCLWCMRLYVLNALIPLLALASGFSVANDMPNGGTLGVAAGVFLGVAGASIGAQQSYRAQLLEGTPEIAELPSEEVTEEVMAAYDDPEGPPPVIEYTVRTEDGNEAVVRTQPDDAWKGNPDAKVAIIEFADFECGYCKRAGFQMRRIFEAYKDDVVFVYKHFPMNPKCNDGVKNPKHRYACLAHEASVCAQKQGKFWAYHDLLYKNNHQLRSEHLVAYAEKVGLDMNVWKTCMQARDGVAKVMATGLEGKAADIHGTPRIWINGQLYRSGSSAEQMARAVEAALGNTGAEANARAAKLRDGRPKVDPIPDDVAEMQHIQLGDLDFHIDTFESSIDNGKAVTGKGKVPAFRMSWFAAKDACEAAGKRICTEREWIAACQSAAPIDDDGDGEFADDLIEGNAYPYGDFHTRQFCWENHKVDRRQPAESQVAWRPVYTGEMPGCRTEQGVYDMAGNIEEWVGDSPENAVLLGGAYDTPDDKARCYRRNNTFGAGYANLRTGFRCCK
jgi:protein-disulfide isomerase/uncharacterized membrane protein